MTPTFISFYTAAYTADARELMLTLDAFDLPQDVRQMPDAGSWVRNCGMKAGFVQAMMRQHPGQSVVWLDADARVRQAPSLFGELTCDFAAHRRGGVELLSGTLYFSGSECSVELVEDWLTECQLHPDRIDQACLDTVLQRSPWVSVSELPAPYTCIFDEPSMGPPVIEHMQKSRKFRTVNVWLAIPSAKDPQACHDAIAPWLALGYKVALFRDAGAQPVACDLLIQDQYEGYAKSVNRLVREILARDPCAAWIVTGGDDIQPIPDHSPGDIARQCTEHFGGTLGVMEPTGDRHMVDADGLCAAERVCIAPWMGREWCERGYQGKGPLDEAFFHYYVDEALACVARKHGILWHRPELTQYHDHWGRKGKRQRPEYLMKAQADWANAKSIFHASKEAGFPGSELL